MRVDFVRLQHFRNFNRYQLELHPKLHLLVGANGRGKTNLLEAIFLAAQGRSFRTSDHRNLICQGEERGEVLASFGLELGGQEVRVELCPDKKHFWRDGKKITIGGLKNLLAVVFSPEEIVAIRSYPQVRRERIDSLLGKISANYLKIIKEYNKILLQRNRLLKRDDLSTSALLNQISIWDHPLVTVGIELIREREKGAKRLSPLIEQFYEEIAEEPSGVCLKYIPNTAPDEFKARLAAAFALERVRGLSLVGPHRDDFCPIVSGKRLREFGSQGEGRSFALAMKLAEISLFQEAWNDSPLLLLDDVASELDAIRNRSFFQYLSRYEGQVLVTATSSTLISLAKTTPHQTTEILANP